MNAFKKKISYFLSNELHRVIMLLLDDCPENFLSQDAYKKFAHMLENKHPKYPLSEAYDAYQKVCLKASKAFNW
eukprot:CAMPEP_0114579268 /NCGR_PEP_ID=MMETSP0125-20121206/3677_1 /TAXON_ID=485358 ORGANISM="Aristerostoma sp., Strain ATCC 50986" /NCGR_SAMPLE_ID=MMETSP0125 /ASSEMBLY_ACC=CAM_ASM_000245 /LENGTH=73 /DNA_ID=CAMNT_0001769907 /DNA_START=6 /DNA_END=224 /DNA_ORIENTATION=+